MTKKPANLAAAGLRIHKGQCPGRIIPHSVALLCNFMSRFSFAVRVVYLDGRWFTVLHPVGVHD